MATNTTTTHDFDDLLQSMIVFMQSQAEFKDYNFDGAGIRQIMRLLAYDAEQRALQNQFAFNELNLDTAQLRPNVVSIAANLGYFSRGRKAARIVTDITVTPKDSPSVGATLVLEKSVRFFANRDGGAVYFSPDQEYSAIINDDGQFVFSGVTLIQGTWTYASFLSSANDAVEAFVIPDGNVDVDTLNVQVRANETTASYDVYTKFKSAYDLGPEAKIFFVKENRNAQFEIEFGDGKVSRKLSFGNVVLLEFLSTDGESGNGIASLTPASGIGPYFDIKVDTLGAISYGGDAPESLSVIKKSAPMSFAAQGNAVTEGDYVAIARELFPDLKSVMAWGGENNNPPRMGYTFVSVSPADGQPLSAPQKAAIKAQLEQYNVGAIDVIVVDPEYIYLVVDTEVSYNPRETSLAAIPFQAKIVDFIKRYSSEKLEQFGAYFNKSQLISLINKIDRAIKGNKTTVQYEKRFLPALNFSGSYSFEFERTLMPGTLIVENFTVADTDFENYSYFIYDVDGLLKLAKRNTITDNVVDLQPIGQIDYSTGKVDLISFIPISIKNGYVRLRVRPQGDESLQAYGRNIEIIQEVNTTLEAKYA